MFLLIQRGCAYTLDVPRFDDIPLYAGAALSLRRVSCDGDDGPRPHEESVDEDYVIFALWGRFVFRDRAADVVISPCRALVLRAGDTYTIEHPHCEGDVCLSMSGGLLTLLTAPCGRTREVSEAAYTRIQRLFGGPRARPAVERLAVEEALCDALAPEDLRPSSSVRDRAIAEVITYTVDLRFDETLALSELSAAAGVGVFHACRAFRRAMDMSIHRYQQTVRLRHALALLLETSLPLARIAADTGFANQGHLGNVFRRRFGLTPARARRHAGFRNLGRFPMEGAWTTTSAP